ncbi:MAG: PIN domain-containing protein [Terriglobales bacterium]|jgi:predicted nucleic acid-binding protein
MKPANAKCFVDTNILIYAHDREAGLKHERARQLVEHLWTTGQGALSTQVLQELCVNLRRRVAHPLASDEIAKLIEDYLSWEIVINSPQSIIAALGIEARYKVSYWDALILHAAESCGAAVLYSEDLAHGQRYGGVEVVDPLRD